MTVQEAYKVLGQEYKDTPEKEVEKWINSASGLAEIFMQQVLKKGIDIYDNK
ncbi:MAG TPA: hypothetical protein VMR59_01560 [Patescibacteria group bacterium]|nr:hypothetical protein [Patescibacteria group bacterium]